MEINPRVAAGETGSGQARDRRPQMGTGLDRMRAAERDTRILGKLASMPFLDRLELAAVCGVSEGLAHNALASLRGQGLIGFVKHRSPLTSTTRRYYVAAEGVKRLAAESNTSQREVLREYCVSAQWQRLLLERLDSVAVIYRLASAIAEISGSLSVLWFRNSPLDCVISLSDGRTIGVVRRGPTSDETSFGKRLWRLLGTDRPVPGALLILLPDDVRLRRARRRLARYSLPVFLSLEEDVAQADAGSEIWCLPSFPNRLDLRYILSRVPLRGGIPVDRVAKRASLPEIPKVGMLPSEVKLCMLSTILRAAEKRMLDCLFQWPMATVRELAGMLGVSRARIYQSTTNLARYGLLSKPGLYGRHGLALSDRGLAFLARRDRTSVSATLKRWSVASENGADITSWRDLTGKLSRHLARLMEHTGAVYRFMAALVHQSKIREGIRVLQISPADQAARYFRLEGILRSVHPDAFGVVQIGEKTQPFFLEWEKRAVRPGTMAARLAPYLRYYSTHKPHDDHGVRPLVFIVFDDHLVEANFLGVARSEMERTGINLPLWVSHKDLIEKAGPLGRAWRNPDHLEYTDVFGMSAL